jgi:ribokinase
MSSSPSISSLRPGRVTVVGTLNVDSLWTVPELPRRGETLLADGVCREFGGKGANQAVAAARHGARVSLIGTVGEDQDGASYRQHLQCEQIDASWVTTVPESPTGSAQIYVDHHADNCIVVHRGANARLDAAMVEKALAAVLPNTDVLSVSLECPPETAGAALRLAVRHEVRAILNASPVHDGLAWAEFPASAVIVNEHECHACFALTPAQLAESSVALRTEWFRARNVRRLIVTRGAEPTLCVTAESIHAIPTLAVQPCDTVGAGDTFAGVLAAQLAEGADWVHAIRHANVAAALSTLAAGAQTAMPTRKAVEAAATGSIRAVPVT